MKKLLFGVIILFSACHNKHYRYTISPDGYYNYHTNAYTLENGCVKFKNLDIDERTICGTFTIQ